jgi:hypothetical protein
MVKLDTLLKLAVKHHLKADDGSLYTDERRKLNIDMNALCPEARAEVYRQIAVAEEWLRRDLEDKLKAIGALPLYKIIYVNGKRVRCYSEKKE